jgi:hypothetical protein
VSVVTTWFGAHFAQLDPLLQSLHRHGGTLRGVVEIELGRGFAGWCGGRLARAMGIPVDARRRRLEVDIRDERASLVWNRRFDNGASARSTFHPVGSWPDGHWIERTGRLRVKLTVDVVEGGWYWRPLGVAIAGVPLPLWLFPRSSAYKRIENGKYVFRVAFALPFLGTALRYGGALDAELRTR